MDILYSILDFPATKWALIMFAFVMPVASLLTWAERRQSAMMQDRLGPNRANLFGDKKVPGRGGLRIAGILHFVADAIKMISKEDIIPANAHKPLFNLAPIIALAPVMIAVAIIPFGPTIYPEHMGQILNPVLEGGFMPTPDDASIRLQILQIDFGLIFYFAILTIANYGATLAGWASYNKWALLGGLRASSQMMSYEVSMGLSLMGVFLFMGTLEPGAMVDAQGFNVLTWGFLTQPIACIVFFIAAIAETKRAPFDLPEGEPEIIGYFVEYSGMRFGMFFLAEFIEIVFISMVMTTVFFGGYHVPGLGVDGFHAFGYSAYLPHGIVVLMQLLAFGLKVVFFCWLQLAIRWTVPRFRPDQLMEIGWKRLLPLALLNIMISALFALIWNPYGV